MKSFCTARETLRQKDRTFPGELGSMLREFTSRLKAEQRSGVQLPKFHPPLTKKEKVLSSKSMVQRSIKGLFLVTLRIFTVDPVTGAALKGNEICEGVSGGIGPASNLQF